MGTLWKIMKKSNSIPHFDYLLIIIVPSVRLFPYLPTIEKSISQRRTKRELSPEIKSYQKEFIDPTIFSVLCPRMETMINYKLKVKLNSKDQTFMQNQSH
jgi:hypothetical protein